MTGQEFVLHPSSGMQVAIHGRIIARAESPKENDCMRGRSHRITVYESTQGELLASIEFSSTLSHELEFCLVERKLSLSEVPELLACQDPTEHIDRVHLREQNTHETARLINAVLKDYDMLGVEVERQLRDFVPIDQTPVQQAPENIKRSVWSGWNPFTSNDV